MGRAVARHALNRARRINQVFHLRVALIELPEVAGHLQRLVNRHVQFHRHILGHGVHRAIGDAQRAAHIADRTARRHGAEGHDLRNMVLAVFINDILNDLAPLFVAKVDVEVGHADALGV